MHNKVNNPFVWAVLSFFLLAFTPSCNDPINDDILVGEPTTSIVDEADKDYFNFLEPRRYPDLYGEVFFPEKVKYGDVVVTKVVSVYDGDTIKVNVSGWPAIVGNKISVRVNGIDTPEMRDKSVKIKELANLAKDFVNRKLRKAEKVELLNMQRDKYFRILADVEIDGNNLGELLIKAKLAKPYDGGTKDAWTINDYNAYKNQ